MSKLMHEGKPVGGYSINDTLTAYKTTDEIDSVLKDTDYIPASDTAGNKKRIEWSGIKPKSGNNISVSSDNVISEKEYAVYQGNYHTATYFYVNKNATSSSETGQISNPFKSLDKALELMNSGRIKDLRLEIIGAGTYTITKSIIGANLHIRAAVPDVKIEFLKVGAEQTSYAGHINFYSVRDTAISGTFEASDLSANASDEIKAKWLTLIKNNDPSGAERYLYSDNSMWTMSYVNFDAILKINWGGADFSNVNFKKNLRLKGAGAQVANCTFASLLEMIACNSTFENVSFNQLTSEVSNLTFKNTTCTYQGSGYAINMRAGNIVFGGTLTMEAPATAQTSNKNAFILLNGGCIAHFNVSESDLIIRYSHYYAIVKNIASKVYGLDAAVINKITTRCQSQSVLVVNAKEFGVVGAVE